MARLVLAYIKAFPDQDTRDLISDLVSEYHCSKQKIAGCLSYLSQKNLIDLDTWLPNKLTFVS
ncbi:MAG: hypothetical protein IKB86_05235 [Clostridia bacterium]|nr:hypothetical protein [Clostridia bacterium]